MRSNGSFGVAMETADPPYLSPKELLERWRCSRSSVDRIARRRPDRAFALVKAGMESCATAGKKSKRSRRSDKCPPRPDD